MKMYNFFKYSSNRISYLHLKRRLTHSVFPVLEDTLRLSDVSLTVTKNKSEEILATYDKLTKICINGGGSKGKTLHVEKNKKVLPRDRVKSILDDDSDILELSVQAGLGLEYGDIPGGGSICAIGKVRGHYCLINANDGTLKGGTFFPVTVTKNLRAQRISSMNRLPNIFLVDSGGGFLPLQADFFPDKHHGGRAFYNEAVDSAVGVPQISLVCGSCTAGGAYVPMMCEDAAITEKIGSIYLGGPPLVKAATGENISSEDLGGARVHCSVSGCTDYLASSESEGFEIIRDVVSTLNIEAPPTDLDDSPRPLYDLNDLDGLCGVSKIDRATMLGVLARLVDGSEFREFKSCFGQNLVAGYARIGGKRVGVLANCGSVTYKDGLKGAHFIQVCDQRDIPLVFLQNSGNLDEYWCSCAESDAEERTGCLRGRTAMMSVLSCAKVPKISLNVGGCHGDDNFTMCGPSFEPHFLFCWPGAEMSLYPASESPQIKEKGKSRSHFSFESHSSWFAASRVLNDGIIVPSESRKVIIQCLRIFDQSRRIVQKKIESPVLRF